MKEKRKKRKRPVNYLCNVAKAKSDAHTLEPEGTRSTSGPIDRSENVRRGFVDEAENERVSLYLAWTEAGLQWGNHNIFLIELFCLFSFALRFPREAAVADDDDAQNSVV